MAEKTMKGFLDELSSSSPTPGGGSVAALAGAMGASLLEMVCSLTIGKEKFKQHDAELTAIKAGAAELKTKLYTLIEKDARAFDMVMESFRMPKNSEDEKKARGEAIQKATREATRVPMETAQCCFEVLKKISSCVEKVNPNAISDIGVGALLSEAGGEGAAFNVFINLSSVKDQSFREESGRRIREIREESRRLREAIVGKVEALVKG